MARSCRCVRRKSGGGPSVKMMLEPRLLTELYSPERLASVPLRALVALAARCARRVQPLWGDLDIEKQTQLERAVEIAEGVAGGTRSALDARRPDGVRTSDWSGSDRITPPGELRLGWRSTLLPAHVVRLLRRLRWPRYLHCGRRTLQRVEMRPTWTKPSRASRTHFRLPGTPRCVGPRSP